MAVSPNQNDNQPTEDRPWDKYLQGDPAERAYRAALAKAQTEAAKQAKDSKGRVGPRAYNYTTMESLIEAAKAAASKHGLAITVPHVEFDLPDGDVGLAHITYEVSHCDGYSERHRRVMPVHADRTPWDKALAAAMTYSLGYYLRDLLQIPRGEEQPDARDDSAYRPPPPPEPKKRTQSSKKHPWDASYEHRRKHAWRRLLEAREAAGIEPANPRHEPDCPKTLNQVLVQIEEIERDHLKIPKNKQYAFSEEQANTQDRGFDGDEVVQQ